MRSTWKRAFATLLTIAMMATLLVVPASAADTDPNLWTYENQGSLYVLTNSTIQTNTNTYDGTTYNGRIKLQSTATTEVKFTATTAGKLTIIFDNTNTSAVAFKIDDTTSVTPTVGKGVAELREFELDAGVHTIKPDAKQANIYYLLWTPTVAGDDEIALSFDVAEGLTVTDLTVNGTAATAASSVNVAKNAVVTFKVTPQSALYSVKEVKFGETALTVAEGVYTISDVGAAAATVTITAESTRVAATDVTVSGKPTGDMKVGDTANLTAAVEPSNTTDELAWTTSNDKVATVSETGAVTAVAVGKATITAKAGDATDTCDVNVVADDGAVFESKNMGAMTAAFATTTTVKYNSTFSVLAGSKTTFAVDSKARNWTDEGNTYTTAANTVMVKFGGAGSATADSLAITTAKPATIKAWGTAGGTGTRQLKLMDSKGAQVGDLIGIASNAASNDPIFGVFEVTEAGTYYLTSNSSTNNVFKVEVVEKDVTPVESVKLTHGHADDASAGDGSGHTIYVGGTGGQGDKTWVGDTTKLYPGSWKMDVTVEPAEADQDIVWSVEDAENSPITVDQTGVVSPKGTALGTGVVVATSKSDPAKLAHCDVTVAPYITGVTIAPTSPSTTMGVATADKLKLTATLALAGGVSVDQLDEGLSDITWISGDTDVLTVSSSGVVTPVKAGSATVTATTEQIGPRSEAKTVSVTVTVNKGTLAGFEVSADSDTYPAGGATATVSVDGVTPNGDLQYVTVKAQAAGGSEITGTRVGATNDWEVVLPANNGSDPVEYTITASYNGVNWDADDATATVTVAAPGAKVLTVGVTTPGDATEIEQDGSLVITAAPKLDGVATSNVTYQWNKDGVAISGETNATLTVTEAGSYTCTVTGVDSTDAAGLTKTSAAVKITVAAPALQSISAALKAAVDGATFTAGAPNTLVINGKKTVVFDVTVTPTDNDEELETDLEVVDGQSLVSATYDATAKTLTVTPLRASVSETVPRTLTLQGADHPDVKWEVKITVKKLAAPATLAKADVTATAPTSATGKGAITIANAVAGQVYRYKLASAETWTDTPAATGATVTIEVAPGTYQVRQKVDAVFQNIPGSQTVTVPAYNAPSHSITVADIADGTVVPESNEVAEGASVDVTVTPDEGYKLEKLWFVKAGDTAENAITATAGVYSFTMPETDVTIYATFVESGEPGPDVPVGPTEGVFTLDVGQEVTAGKLVVGQEFVAAEPATQVPELGTEGLFTIITKFSGGSVAEAKNKNTSFKDGYAAPNCFKLGGSASVMSKLESEGKAIKFTTGAKSTVKVWWASGSGSGSSIAMANRAGDEEPVQFYADAEKSAQHEGVIAIIENVPAGTNYIYSPDGTARVYKIEVTIGDATPTPTVDKTALTAALAAAKAIDTTAVKTSADGADVPTTEKWVTPAVKDALTKAIADAEKLGESATQAEVDAATKALTDATAAWNPADGLKTEGGESANKTALSAAITAAEKAVPANIYVVGDDTKVSDVNRGTKFMTETDKAAYDTALANAKAVLADAAATQADVDAAVTALNAAAKKVKTGTKSTGTTPGGTTSRPSGGRDEAATGTETKADGSTVTTTTDRQGNKTVITQRPDGSKITAITTADGTVTIAATNADGETVADVKVPGTMPTNPQRFVDVPDDHWAAKSINDMAVMGMVRGVDDVNHIFDMKSDITRGGVATILFRFSNGKTGLENLFSDVADRQWYTDGIAWANKVGVVNGFEDGTFKPDGAITREQMAAMIARYAKLIGLDTTTNGDLSAFVDGLNVQTWAVDGMAWCVANGIVNGRGNGTLAPGATASRAEAAAMLDRFIQLLK